MNREQRRRAKKDKPKKAFNPDSGLMALNTRLFLANTEATSANDQAAIVTDCFIRFDQLTSDKTLTTSGFIELCEANCFSFCLAKRLYEFSANDETSQKFTPAQKDCEDAAEALTQASLRFQESGTYEISQTEAKSLLSSLQWLKEMVALSTRDHVLFAMRESEKIVTQAMKARHGIVIVK